MLRILWKVLTNEESFSHIHKELYPIEDDMQTLSGELKSRFNMNEYDLVPYLITFIEKNGEKALLEINGIGKATQQDILNFVKEWTSSITTRPIKEIGDVPRSSIISAICQSCGKELELDECLDTDDIVLHHLDMNSKSFIDFLNKEGWRQVYNINGDACEVVCTTCATIVRIDAK